MSRPADAPRQYSSRSGRMSCRIVVAISSIDLCVDDSHADAFAPHHRLGLGDFVAAVLQRGVACCRAALVADLRQALRLDRQAEALALVRRQRRRQLRRARSLPGSAGSWPPSARAASPGTARSASCRCGSRRPGSRRPASRLRALWPSSCARLKLIASMRSWYSWLLLTSEKRPTRWLRLHAQLDLQRPTKVPNMSSTMALAAFPITMRALRR